MISADSWIDALAGFAADHLWQSTLVAAVSAVLGVCLRRYSARVRHPIYLGWVLMVFATPVMTTTRLSFAVVSTLYLIAAIPLEERLLIENFGDKYRAYQRQMRWRLLPFVW